MTAFNEVTIRNIEACRRLKGLTKTQLAEESGIKLATLERRFAFKGPALNFNELEAIAGALGVNKFSLMQEEMPEPYQATG